MNENILGFSLEDAQLYKALLYSSPDAVVIYDLKGNVLFINSVFTEIFGFTLEELRGKKVPFVPEDEIETSLKVIQEVLDGKICHAFATKRYTKSGKIVDISISAACVTNENNEPIGMLVILRDITEKNKLKEKLNQMERLESLGRLAGGIAHDFNNLLMGMQGNIDILKIKLMNSDNWDKLEKHIETLSKLINSGNKLTKQLLGYARKGSYKLEVLNPNLIIKNIAYTFGRTKKQITIDLKFKKDIKNIKADEGQIEQVFYNLLINAADSMDNKGNIDIETKTVNKEYLKIKKQMDKATADEYVLITVKDTGKGMSKETQKYIFDPFFTTKNRGHIKGTGLGLASVYGIIKAHEGYIYVTSDIGKGAKFEIYLPAYEKEEEKKSANQTIDNLKDIVFDDKKTSILLVDDEEDILDSTKELLEALNFKVFICSEPANAIEIFKKLKGEIDIVMLDVIMPEMDGFELFKNLKKIKHNLKVIMSSGYIINEKVQKDFANEAVAFLQKPYNARQLFNAIKSI